MYSTIDADNNKYVIQGKDLNSLTTNEIISIGYKTSIDVPTIYTVSIEVFFLLFLNTRFKNQSPVRK